MHRSVISIAMATYNGAPYLEEQLQSLSRQTRQPDELVVCDDGSTDATITILERFAASAPFPVQLIRNERRLGPLENFAKAAGLCDGEIVFLSDQDDIWYPDKLERVAAQFAEHPKAMVLLNDARLVDEQGRSSGHTQYRAIREASLSDRYFITGCCSAHRKIWQSLTMPVPHWVAAYDYWVNRFAHEAGCALVHPHVLQDYRRHGSNESQSVLSDPAGASSLHLVRMHGLKDARETWRVIERMLSEMLARLEATDQSLPAPMVGAARRRIAAHRDALLNRIALCSMSRSRRPRRLLKSWARGDYAFFQGWKSALKDLIRP